MSGKYTAQVPRTYLLSCGHMLEKQYPHQLRDQINCERCNQLVEIIGVTGEIQEKKS